MIPRLNIEIYGLEAERIYLIWVLIHCSCWKLYIYLQIWFVSIKAGVFVGISLDVLLLINVKIFSVA